MAEEEFQRARSREAKQVREAAILDAARELATESSVREVTLTDIAAVVGMHKSAMLRYFETREEIFLRLAAMEWQQWSQSVRNQLDRYPERSLSGSRPAQAQTTARMLAKSLVDRPLFCDLLAHVPLHLERNVSVATVRTFKLTALAASAVVATALRRVLPLSSPQARNVVVTATSMAGALWQMAAPGHHLREVYQADPQLRHAVVDVGPRLAEILNGLLVGYSAGAQ